MLALATLVLAQVAAPPPPPKGPWPGIAKISARRAFVAAGGKPKFDTPTHVALVGHTGECSEKMGRAQWYQDVVLQLAADAHFDNCAYEESIRYISDLLGKVDGLVGKANPNPHPKQVIQAIGLLGQALHGVQDFYAHSNYVELMAKKEPFGENLVLPLWTPEGADAGRKLIVVGVDKTTLPDGLCSGRVSWDGPKRCSDRVPVHHELAKDSEAMVASQQNLERWNRTAYDAADTLADYATRHFLRYAYDRWGSLRSYCGEALAYLPPADRRTE